MESETDLSKKYEDSMSTIRDSLMEEFSYTNIHQVPKLEKITLNMGVGEASQDRKRIESAVNELSLISGQRPVITRARKALASFKLREGVPVGCKVTLRRRRMYEFLHRLVNVTLPRVRDFRGLNGKSFDGNGNFSMGITEQIVFLVTVQSFQLFGIKAINVLNVT